MILCPYVGIIQIRLWVRAASAHSQPAAASSPVDDCCGSMGWGKRQALSAKKNPEKSSENSDEAIDRSDSDENNNFTDPLEIAFAKIWDGDDANADLKALSEKIMSQVIGEEYTEEYIDVPVEKDEEEMTGEDIESDTEEESSETDDE